MADSTTVGLHPSILAYDITDGDGMDVGYNPDQTIALNKDGADPAPRETYWYAGRLVAGADGKVTPVPAEFGAVNLAPADPVMQRQAGLYGALIIEPAGSSWVEDATTHAMATVTPPGGKPYREAVALWQNDLQNYTLGPWGAVNYRTEAASTRYPASFTPQVGVGYSQFFSNTLVYDDPKKGDPQTPVFRVPAGMPTRFRALFPGGSTNSMSNIVPVIMLEGHNWQEEPYAGRGGTAIGFDRLSQYLGSQALSPGEAINMVLPSAGGVAAVEGDYLYHGYQHDFHDGSWGLLRVMAGAAVIAHAQVDGSGRLVASGFLGPIPADSSSSRTVQLSSVTVDASGKILTKTPLKTLSVDPKSGAWALTSADGIEVRAGTILYAESPEADSWPGVPGLAPVSVSPSTIPVARAARATSPAATSR
jgi:hypothetical protein